MKRTAAFLLSVLLLFSAGAEAGAAALQAENAPPASVLRTEKFTGGLQYLLGRFWKLITFKNEARIEKAAPRGPAGEERDTPLFTGEAEQTLSAETWRMVELAFESEKTYADPFSDVTIDLSLYGNGRLYTVPCFWDGENIWRARFVCPAAGTWQCKTVCSDTSNDALHGRTAEVNCAEYKGDLDIYKHGFVTTRYGEKYLTYDDGTPFYYLGDTHWELSSESYEMVEALCAKRAEQGFSVWQSQPGAKGFELIDGLDAADIDGFQAFDEYFRIISEAGLTHANTQFFWPLAGMTALIEAHGGWTEPCLTGKLKFKKVTMPDVSDEAKAYLEQISRYWVARYAAYPVIWSLGQEIDNDPYQNEDSPWNAVNNPYRYVAEYLNKYDPYDHPVTAHQESTGDTVAYGNGLGTGEMHMIYYPNGAPSAFRSVPAHTMYASQWHPHFNRRDDYVSAKDYWYNGQGKPVVNFEGLYCYLWTQNYGARAQAWASYLTGLYGCSWGGQPTWAYKNTFQIDIPSDDGVDTITPEEKQAATWQDAMEYPSAYQMGYMRSFMEKLEWYNLIPRFNNRAYFVPASHVYAYCASNKENTEMVLYFYSYTDESVAERINTKDYGGVLTGTVGSLKPRAEYTYQWFDPITGEYGEQGTFTASAVGTWFAGVRPDDTDMVLLIQKAV